jgi:hypothetical protein
MSSEAATTGRHARASWRRTTEVAPRDVEQRGRTVQEQD